MTGLCAACLAAPAGYGLAQPETVTTVSPLTVRPLAPVPDVGDGAPYFSGDEIATARAVAARNAAQARALVRASGIDERFDFNPFSDWFTAARALCRTVGVTSNALVGATDALDAATAAAIAARAGAARGEIGRDELEATELTRQTAARNFSSIREQALEADQRVLDFLSLHNRYPAPAGGMDLWVGETNRRTEIRRANGGVFVPADFQNLRLERVTVRQIPRPDGAVVRVAGRIVNRRMTPVSVPYLVLVPLDRAGFPMHAQEKQIVGPKGTRIRANGTFNFGYELKPVPEGATSFRVNFATEWRPGVMDARTCGDLDPDATEGGGAAGSAADAQAATQAGAAESGGAATGVSVGAAPGG